MTLGASAAILAVFAFAGCSPGKACPIAMGAGAGGMPQFIVSGFTNIGYDYPYLQYVQPIYQYTANASWIKGVHNLRFGLDINRQHMKQGIPFRGFPCCAPYM